MKARCAYGMPFANTLDRPGTASRGSATLSIGSPILLKSLPYRTSWTLTRRASSPNAAPSSEWGKRTGKGKAVR